MSDGDVDQYLLDAAGRCRDAKTDMQLVRNAAENETVIAWTERVEELLEDMDETLREMSINAAVMEAGEE